MRYVYIVMYRDEDNRIGVAEVFENEDDAKKYSAVYRSQEFWTWILVKAVK